MTDVDRRREPKCPVSRAGPVVLPSVMVRDRDESGPRNEGTPADGSVHEFAALTRRIEDVARRTFLATPHARDTVRSLPPLDLTFRVTFGEPGEHGDGAHQQARRLAETLQGHVDDAILACSAFRPGRVFCLFCNSAECAHARPGDPKHVFRAYSQTGVPLWTSLLDLAIERADERVDAIAAERGAAILLCTDRDEITQELLPAYGNALRAYDIRGQLILGYFRFGQNGGSEKFAVSLQLIRSTTRSGAARLGLNAIGLLPSGGDATSLLTDPDSWSFAELFHAAQRRLADINVRLRGVAKARRARLAEDEADELLSDMSLGAGRRQRRTGWRTEHANRRAAERTRPTGMARQDLQSVRHDRVLHDRKSDSFVVLGGKGRVHVFSDAGLHVTSMHLDRKDIDARLATKRWQPVESPRAHELVARAHATFEAASRTPKAP